MRVVECEIYDLSSDSWRVLDSFPLDYSLYFEGMSLKGDTYWIAEDKVTELFLIKFDSRQRDLCVSLFPCRVFIL